MNKTTNERNFWEGQRKIRNTNNRSKSSTIDNNILGGTTIQQVKMNSKQNNTARKGNTYHVEIIFLDKF